MEFLESSLQFLRILCPLPDKRRGASFPSLILSSPKMSSSGSWSVKEVEDTINYYLVGFFDPTDGYMEYLRENGIQATADGVITMPDGKLYQVKLAEIPQVPNPATVHK